MIARHGDIYFPTLNLSPKGKIFSPENLSRASISTKKRWSLMARMRRCQRVGGTGNDRR
ncbi:hypothetical protein CXB51_021206 [Gossypium anomalum]|uniref:Uncharacterized protein n=1 Tax=Gossypium anomalum TaxID=47600 RepID=A0A8J5Y9V8_9ROSI|nr:hypothetical protein CXB51_021206 [Gossypium anomalum]